MTSVNPPPQLKIPPELLKNDLTREYHSQLGVVLFQLWTRTGGSTDDIEDSKQNITGTSSRVSRNAARINSLELKEFEIVNTNTDVTTSEFQVVICKNESSINVTLDPNARKDDEVHIKRRNGAINVIGLIDGITNKKINIKNYSMHLVFDGDDWSEI